MNLIEPYTVFAILRNSIDFRIAQLLPLWRQPRPGVDLYNLMNADVVTNYNQAFIPGGSVVMPTAIEPARYVEGSACRSTSDF